ncbi:MAG: SDR family NAD(P)-dependent oxidoreductase, partial [Chloroflexi bacterium]|nr:SDR family NAD(P)-dependent oxidoreductase [Chloroflexota bacterium]
MDKKLDGKVAAITGGGRGIGRAIALAMAAEGARVVVNAVRTKADGTTSAAEVVEKIQAAGGKAVATQNDIGDIEGCENIINAAVTNFGRIDIVVNNAGVFFYRKTLEMSQKDWDL